MSAAKKIFLIEKRARLEKGQQPKIFFDRKKKKLGGNKKAAKKIFLSGKKAKRLNA